MTEYIDPANALLCDEDSLPQDELENRLALAHVLYKKLAGKGFGSFVGMAACSWLCEPLQFLLTGIRQLFTYAERGLGSYHSRSLSLRTTPAWSAIRFMQTSVQTGHYLSVPGQ